MESKHIGVAFSDELKEAGLMGLPFSWGDDGTFSFDESMSEEQISMVLKVYDNHDPEAYEVEDAP